MGKFYDENGDEVVAFSQEELDSKLEEEKARVEQELGSNTSEVQKTLKEKEEELAKAKADYEKLSKSYDSRKEEYENLKTKFEETGQTLDQTTKDRQAAFEKMRDNMISKAAGEDKEYAEKLREAYDRVGSETLDLSQMETHMKEAHAIAQTHLERDFTPFSIGGGTTGEPPRVGSEEKSFSETDEGKATLDVINRSLGNPTPKEDK